MSGIDSTFQNAAFLQSKQQNMIYSLSAIKSLCLLWHSQTQMWLLCSDLPRDPYKGREHPRDGFKLTKHCTLYMKAILNFDPRIWRTSDTEGPPDCLLLTMVVWFVLLYSPCIMTRVSLIQTKMLTLQMICKINSSRSNAAKWFWLEL